MTDNRMYSQRAKQGNVPVMRYCNFRCSYCAFQKFLKISSCSLCRENVNHTHLETLQRRPPKTKKGEFLTVGLSGDVSFMSVPNFAQTLLYCMQWRDRTYLIQSKNPEYFLQFDEKNLIPDNVILGTTIETNRAQIWYAEAEPKAPAITDYLHYRDISNAPLPYKRYASMMKLKETGCRLLVTAEPLLDFDLDSYGSLYSWIKRLNPIFYIGYANDGKQGKRLRLPEPPLEKTLELIARLREAGIEVREKTVRKSWWE